ncbi:KANL1 protein, partial [Polypterus senegalus]
MAAMAPALTDAPGEAHHIRFKVAPPSSTLSPGSVENNSNASNILISSNGTTKHKAIVSTTTAEDLGFCSSPKKEEQQQRSKLPALVTSFLCSDVPPVGSTKDPVKLQGVFFKQASLKSRTRLNPTIFNNSNIKAELLAARQHQTLEFSGDNRKTMSGSGQTPVNGLSKKVTKSAVDTDSGGPGIFATANGGKTMPVVSSDQEQLIPEGIFKDGITSCTIIKGEALEELPVGNLRNLVASESFTAVNPLSPCTDAADSRTGKNGVLNPGFSLGSESEGWSTSRQINPLSSPSLSPFSTLDAEIRARTLQNQSRQNEIESRVRRLRKRLQVVQAKQVERHVQQQLGGFLQTSFSKLPSLDSLRQRSPAVLTRKAEAALRRVATENSTSDGLGQFLKSGTVPTELERLFLSGTANLMATERAFDSDVTDSSSGGETDIEEEELTKVDIEQRHFPLWKRAEGRFAMERASIVSYWNWLQAHISDLEYRIRQQTDIYRQIRANKGLLQLRDVTSDSPAEDVVNVNLEASGCRQMAQDNHMLDVESASPNPVPLKAYVSSKPVNGVVNSWREVDICSQPIAEEDDAAEVEDLSDAMFAAMHLKCEELERSRWTWTASAPAQRRGSSPASPDLISNPYTPGSRDSHRPQSSEDTRCSTPDLSFEELTVQPWERRNFPLLDDPVIDCGDHSELQDRPPRNIRRVSGSKSVNKETENGTAPPVMEDTKQRLQTAMRAAHR